MPREREKGKGKASPNTVPEKAEGIVVTAQQSRFKVDASDAPTLREIDIKDLNITVNGRDLLLGAHLRLEDGVHYCLVGRNGTGKSTLLRSLAEERIPGIASNIQCLLLGQTMVQTITAETSQSASANESALEHVLRSDTQREKALHDFRLLSDALNSTEPLDAVKSIRKIKHSRLEYTLKRAKLIAARRSGARGWDARAELNRVEDLVVESQQLLEQAENNEGIDSHTIETETNEAVQILNEIQASLELADWASAETRARHILLGLRFSEEMIDGPYANLSGGWRMRCDLASALFQRLDLLMLDEPTNYLDLPVVIWLQEYLKATNCTVLVVTHDRDFADAIAEELIVLREQKLEYFNGNLSLYESERYAKIRQMTRMKEAQDKKKAHMEKTIENNVAAAKRSGDDKKLKQAKSRQKKLDDRMGIEVSAKGTRFKLNRDLAGYHTTSRAAIEIPQNDPTIRIVLPNEPPDLRFPGALVTFENVSFRYPKARDDILKDVSLVIHNGDRVGLAGVNGSGKSTLVKLAVASDSGTAGIRPTNGTVVRHPRLRIGYFSQHLTEELEALGMSRRDLTALSYIMEVAGAEIPESKARGLLGGMGLPGRLASDVPIESLSGGQRVRLALARLLWSPPQLLVLDEVTTHLDTDTIVALIEALKTFQGAVLVVTHDRFFMRCVIEGEKVYKRNADSDGESDESEEEDDDVVKPGKREVYRLVKGSLRKLDGGMAQYEEIVSKRVIKA